MNALIKFHGDPSDICCGVWTGLDQSDVQSTDQHYDSNHCASMTENNDCWLYTLDTSDFEVEIKSQFAWK